MTDIGNETQQGSCGRPGRGFGALDLLPISSTASASASASAMRVMVESGYSYIRADSVDAITTVDRE